MKTEIWRAVVGFEGSYEVSNQGRVRSRTRLIRARSKWGGHYMQWRKGRVLRPGSTTSGHLTVVIGSNSRSVHALVLRAFIGPCPPRHEGRHLNGRPTNNRLTNLCWSRRRENTQDRKHHKGATNHILKPSDVRHLRKLYHAGVERGFFSAMARSYGMSAQGMRAAVIGLHHQDVQP